MDLQGIGLFLLIFALWIALNRWVLPRFGIRTCMSGCCTANQDRPAPAAPQVEFRGDES